MEQWTGILSLMFVVEEMIVCFCRRMCLEDRKRGEASEIMIVVVGYIVLSPTYCPSRLTSV
jgi:hypothetical protein